MSQLTADLLLLAVTFIWGSTFVVVKNAIGTMGPLTFISVRFLIAGLTLILWRLVRSGLPGKAPGESKRFYLGGVLAGLALGFSYAMQTLGLVTVSAGKAAFITGLYVVFVPVASKIILRTTPDLSSMIGVSLATVGMGLLSLRLPFAVATGDFLVFLCALGFAAHILLVGAYSGSGDPVLFTGIQLLVVAAGAGVFALALERPIVVPASAWATILFTALLATSAAFLIQSAVQRYTSATHTALIFSAEPVFGALFAWVLAKETLDARELAGAALILTGMLVSEMKAIKGQRQGCQ